MRLDYRIFNIVFCGGGVWRGGGRGGVGGGRGGVWRGGGGWGVGGGFYIKTILI